MTGWWFEPTWKICSSIGRMTFPSEWKNNMFQTTNQIFSIYQLVISQAPQSTKIIRVGGNPPRTSAERMMIFIMMPWFGGDMWGYTHISGTIWGIFRMSLTKGWDDIPEFGYIAYLRYPGWCQIWVVNLPMANSENIQLPVSIDHGWKILHFTSMIIWINFHRPILQPKKHHIPSGYLT